MKTFLKRLFIPLLASPPFSVLAKSIYGNSIPIFMIHRINVDGHNPNGISPTHLRNCLDYLLKNNYSFVSIEDIIDSLKNQTVLPEKSVAFTMDDGYIEQGMIAAPIFHEFRCPLTFFVISGLLDKSLWPWDAQVSWIIDHTHKSQITVNLDDELLNINISDGISRSKSREIVRNTFKEMDSNHIHELINNLAEAADIQLPKTAPPAYQAMSWGLARKLEREGVRIAPHSITHRILSKLNKESAKKEIIGSWNTLTRELSNPLKVFCYPTGRFLDFGPREIDILKNENFLGGISTSRRSISLNDSTDNQVYHLPRLELPNNMTDFIQYCSWLERARRSA